MQFRDSHLKVSHTNLIVCALSKLQSAIIHGIEFSYLVVVADFTEQRSDLFSSFRLSKVILLNTKLSVA